MHKLYCLRLNGFLGGEAMKEGKEEGTNIWNMNLGDSLSLSLSLSLCYFPTFLC